LSDKPSKGRKPRSGYANAENQFLGAILIQRFNSLIPLETSLLFDNNSLFRILGNSEEKYRCLRRFLRVRHPIGAQIDEIPCIFPDDQGNDAESSTHQTASSAINAAVSKFPPVAYFAANQPAGFSQ
jgi:hypothetical protein